MIVISDASPLITLSKIGLLTLLPRLYQTVHVSPDVYSEVTVSGHGMWGAAEVAKADWIRVKAAGSDLMITLAAPSRTRVR